MLDHKDQVTKLKKINFLEKVVMYATFKCPTQKLASNGVFLLTFSASNLEKFKCNAIF